MTRRIKGWGGAAVLVVLVALGLVWALWLPDAETDVYADDLPRQNRTGEGSNVDGVAGQKVGSESVLLPEETGVIVEGSTDANDVTTIADPDAEVLEEGGSRLEPDDVISPETGEVQNDTGMVMVDPDTGIEGDPDDPDAETDRTDAPDTEADGSDDTRETN
ncbi:hypothetical protein [Citreimonas sp.]|uniref:hypothetical protein n=1 Tax=Citreimonas sp. TaxID=3036715 RepID=UPI0035C7CB0F